MDKPQAQPEPEKYIRTFAGDMETLQAGGTPDLVALAKPAERLVEASPFVPIQSQAPMEMPPPSPLPAYVPLPQTLARVETYASDFADRMKDTQASTATVLAAEQDSAPRTPQREPENSSHTVLYVVAGCTLLLVGVAGAYGAYTRYLTAQAPIALTPSALAPIFVDEREEVSGSGSALLETVKTSLTQTLAPNHVKLLYVASTSDASIFSQLPLSAPDVLLRNIEAAGSMMGIISIGGSQSPFFILSVSSYSNTFSGMLSWEKTMPRDLGKLFPSYAQSFGGQTSSASTTTTSFATTTPVVGASGVGFVDTVIANHDVRVYRDASDRAIVLYGYWNQTTLVLARDATAFTEVVQRLATSRAQK